MGAVYGSMTNAEVNELARNLRETEEYDALLSLGIENGLDEAEVKAFYDGTAQLLVPEDEDPPEADQEDEKGPEAGNPVSEDSAEPEEEPAAEPPPAATPPASEGESAVDKLRRELANGKDNRVPAKPITDHLIELCGRDEDFGRLVQQAHKSLKRCCDYVYEQARNRIQGGVGWLDDDVTYQIAEDYYRLDDAEIERKKAKERKAAEAARAKAEAERKAAAPKKAPEKHVPPKKEKGVPDQLSLF